MSKTKKWYTVKKISVVVNFYKIEGSVTPRAVFNRIKSSEFKELVGEIRNRHEIGDSKKADELKKTLPGFATSGEFKGARSANNLAVYSQLLVLDLDDQDRGSIEELKNRIIKIPYTMMCFISPSGSGLKVMVCVDSKPEHHKEAFKQVLDYYEEKLGIKFDKQTSDIARQCYFSYDDKAFLNENETVFNVDLQKITAPIPPKLRNSSIEDMDFDYAFNLVVNYTENISQFEKGNRNNFIHLLACNSCRWGLPKEKITVACIEKYHLGFNENEIAISIESAYKQNDKSFATEAWRIASKKEGISNEEAPTLNTPFIPEFVIENLPDFIKVLTINRDSAREKDIIITSMIVLLGGCLRKTIGYYDGSIVYPCLYSFVVAPAGSGKGVMQLAKDAVDQVKKDLEKEGIQDIAQYRAQCASLKEGENAPVEPPQKLLFVPGNATCAAIIEHLRNCAGIGILFETEADAIGNMFKNEWGDYSQMLRRAFQHEVISSLRKSSGKIEVDMPRLTIAISGTPSQVLSIIKTTEDGLFSRFIYYYFDENSPWRDVSPKVNDKEFYRMKQRNKVDIAAMVKHLNRSEIEVCLTEEQWQKLNKHFSAKLSQFVGLHSDELNPTVKRMGLIAFRIVMILTSCRKYEDDLFEEKIVCSDLHFSMALQLADVYLEHAAAMLHNLPKRKFENSRSKELMKLYEVLPVDVVFGRAEVIKIAKDAGIDVYTKTIDNYLEKLVKAGLILKEGFNKYIKKEKAVN